MQSCFFENADTQKKSRNIKSSTLAFCSFSAHGGQEMFRRAPRTPTANIHFLSVAMARRYRDRLDYNILESNINMQGSRRSDASFRGASVRNFRRFAEVFSRMHRLRDAGPESRGTYRKPKTWPPFYTSLSNKSSLVARDQPKSNSIVPCRKHSVQGTITSSFGILILFTVYRYVDASSAFSTQTVDKYLRDKARWGYYCNTHNLDRRVKTLACQRGWVEARNRNVVVFYFEL